MSDRTLLIVGLLIICGGIAYLIAMIIWPI
ncbi:hypothetical protein ABIE49_002624 [Bradyrhizobium sp. OAE829]